jgi:hypothetical protein
VGARGGRSRGALELKITMASDHRMPFGKHRGCALSELPGDYLAWLGSLPDLRDPLRSAVRSEQARRLVHPDAGPATMPPELRAVAVELVGAGHRALARRYHPDVGGDTTRMRQTNLAAEALRSLLERAA